MSVTNLNRFKAWLRKRYAWLDEELDWNLARANSGLPLHELQEAFTSETRRRESLKVCVQFCLGARSWAALTSNPSGSMEEHWASLIVKQWRESDAKNI